jgi:endonuclease YncB( thermonuclease family)
VTLRTFARLLFATVCLCASATFADNLVGQASIIDGDTLEIHGTRIRLWGIDAPESNQLCRGEDSIQYRCGAKAANDLDSNDRSIACLSALTNTGAQLPSVRLTALTLPTG